MDPSSVAARPPEQRPSSRPGRGVRHKQQFVKTARRYRTIQIQAGDHVITAADPLPDDLRAALTKINDGRRGAQ